jgi:hypothetical protein
MAYIPKGNSAWLLRKAINRSDSAIADLETNMAVLARTASNTGTSATTQVLFNDAGIVNGDAGLVYNKTTDALTVTGPLSTGGTLVVTGASTLTGAATVQGLTLGKGGGAVNQNTAFGFNVFNASTTGINCTGVGYEALKNLTIGANSTAVGYTALSALTTGNSNTAIGNRALESNQTGDRNTAVGVLSLVTPSGNSDNTSVGYAAIYQSIGSNNVAIGSNAGISHLIGSNNAFFGANAQPSATTISDEYTYGNASVVNHRFPNGNIVMGTSGKGIDFTATANSSGNLQTSELLADYEEGTWVPTDSSGAGLTLTPLFCRYTKIGRAVTIQGRIDFPSTANTALAQIGGLPFAAGDFFPINITLPVSTSATYILGFGGSSFYIYSASTPLTNANLTGATIYFGGTYMT